MLSQRKVDLHVVLVAGLRSWAIAITLDNILFPAQAPEVRDVPVIPAPPPPPPPLSFTPTPPPTPPPSPSPPPPVSMPLPAQVWPALGNASERLAFW